MLFGRQVLIFQRTLLNVYSHFTTLKMKATGPSKTLVPFYQSKLHHIAEDINPCKTLMFHTF